jgi:hypothetical protein
MGLEFVKTVFGPPEFLEKKIEKKVIEVRRSLKKLGTL